MQQWPKKLLGQVRDAIRRKHYSILHIRTVHELLGHKDVRTTMIYTHVLNRRGLAVRSLLDAVHRSQEVTGQLR